MAFLLGVLLTAEPVQAATLTPEQAKDHIGETATVCGVVATATYAARTRGAPTFLNLGQPYPRHIFTAVIWGSERLKFGQPEVTYQGKRICVTGRIQSYRDRPEIILKDPGQLTIEGGSK